MRASDRHRPVAAPRRPPSCGTWTAPSSTPSRTGWRPSIALVDEFGGRWTDDDARSIIGFDLLDTAAVLRDRGSVRPRADRDRRAPARRGHRRGPRAHAVAARRPAPAHRTATARASRARSSPCRGDRSSTPCSRRWRRSGSKPSSRATRSTNGKPHPEPYLRAATALGVDPVQCVAIEDSPTGVTSAAAAGCVVVAVPNLVNIEPAPGGTSSRRCAT